MIAPEEKQPDEDYSELIKSYSDSKLIPELTIIADATGLAATDAERQLSKIATDAGELPDFMREVGRCLRNGTLLMLEFVARHDGGHQSAAASSDTESRKAIVAMNSDELCDEMDLVAVEMSAIIGEARKKFDVSLERAKEFATNPEMFSEFLSEFFVWTKKFDAATRTTSFVMNEFNKRRI